MCLRYASVMLYWSLNYNSPVLILHLSKTVQSYNVMLIKCIMNVLRLNVKKARRIQFISFASLFFAALELVPPSVSADVLPVEGAKLKPLWQKRGCS